MTKNLFFASCAKAAFALAAVLMTSTVFTSCSKDNSDDPKPEPKANTVTIDGAERPILKAEYEDMGNGNYNLYLNLSADGKERVEIELNKAQHMTGSPIDLTKREETHDGKWYWVVEYYKPDDTKLIDTYGRPGEDYYPVFTTGTLTISGSPDGTINIRLENGRVKGEDGAEHTIVLSYSGTMTKYVKPEPKVNTVTIDGAEKPILKAEYEDEGDGDYTLNLYLSADGKERVRFELNKDLHITGSPIDLTEKEKTHDGKWYWSVDCYKPDDTKLINTFGSPDSSKPVFTTGTLIISGSPEGTINIKLENGRVKDEDGAEHTLTVSYSGKMDKSSGTPTPKTQIVTLDGEEKPILKAEYEDEGNGNYSLYLYLSADRKEKVEFQLNKDLHMTGSPVNLTKKEEEHDGKWYWSVDYYKPDNTKLINTFGSPSSGSPVFTTGTLTISGSPEGTINIKLENGRVKGKDGAEHTLTISYSGTMTEL